LRALDTETYLILPGLGAPKLVVGQVADVKIERLITPLQVRDLIREASTKGEVLGFANAPFDLIVACAMFPELIPLCFDLLERGLIKDTHIRQALLDLGRGTFKVDTHG